MKTLPAACAAIGVFMAAPAAGVCGEASAYPCSRTAQPETERAVAPSAAPVATPCTAAESLLAAFVAPAESPAETPAVAAFAPFSTPSAPLAALAPTTETPAETLSAAAEVPELPLPQVPATLRTPPERAAYIVRHFWDALDFADTLRSHDREFMEQNFANCLSLFPIADTTALAPAVAALVGRAQSDAEALSLLAETAEKYLYEQDSPLFNEEYYLLFADALATAPLHDYERLRIEAQRTAMRKNRVGTTAADFSFETPDGRLLRLSEAAQGRALLLLFYDPDCDHCMQTIAELAASEPLNEALSRGCMAVVAVYAGFGSRDRAAWLRTLDRLPAAWTAGFDGGTIYTRDLYVLRNLPALYLLDASGRVLLKDATPASLDERLRDITLSAQ